MQTSESKSIAVGYTPRALAGLTIVAISDGARSFGLYRVKQIDQRTMVLSHGAISFPVGTLLDVEDYQYCPPNPASFHQRATVTENNHEGIRLVW